MSTKVTQLTRLLLPQCRQADPGALESPSELAPGPERRRWQAGPAASAPGVNAAVLLERPCVEGRGAGLTVQHGSQVLAR